MTLESLPAYRQNKITEMNCCNILVLSVVKGYLRLKLLKTSQITKLEEVSFFEKDTLIFGSTTNVSLISGQKEVRSAGCAIHKGNLD